MPPWPCHALSIDHIQLVSTQIEQTGTSDLIMCSRACVITCLVSRVRDAHIDTCPSICLPKCLAHLFAQLGWHRSYWMGLFTIGLVYLWWWAHRLWFIVNHHCSNTHHHRNSQWNTKNVFRSHLLDNLSSEKGHMFHLLRSNKQPNHTQAPSGGTIK